MPYDKPFHRFEYIGEIARKKYNCTRDEFMAHFRAAAEMRDAQDVYDRLDSDKYSFEAEEDHISIAFTECPICGGLALLEKFYQHEIQEDYFHRVNIREAKYNASTGFPRKLIVTQLRCKHWRTGCGVLLRSEKEMPTETQ